MHSQHNLKNSLHTIAIIWCINGLAVPTNQRKINSIHLNWNNLHNICISIRTNKQTKKLTITTFQFFKNTLTLTMKDNHSVLNSASPSIDTLVKIPNIFPECLHTRQLIFVEKIKKQYFNMLTAIWYADHCMHFWMNALYNSHTP